MKIVEDFSKVPDMKLPEVTPDRFDTQALVAQFSNGYKYLLTEVIPDHS